MIITTTRSPVAAFIDTLLTALAWLFFIYLLGSGMLAILTGARSAPDLSPLARVLPSMGTLSIYVAVAVVNALVLLLWARYNAVRYGGMDRRSPSEHLDDVRLARSFGVDIVQRMRSARSKAMTVHHTDEGRIRGIDFHDQRDTHLRSVGVSEPRQAQVSWG
jgi:biofilm PGA synthesis protein PgaD